MQAASRTWGQKWGLCLLLLAATTLIYLDRQALSILAPTIQAELHLDNRDLGWVFSIFYYAYTLAQFGVGTLLDRYSLRWMYGGAIVAWALASALTGTATTFAALLGIRVLVGVTESGNWPAALRIVSRALPPSERALGNGIFTSGTSLGALIAPFLIIGIAQTTGWRYSFAVLSILALAWLAVWVWSTRAPELKSVWKADAGERLETGWSAYRNAVRLEQFWRVFCVTILVNPVLYFFLNWLPTYYKQQHGIGPGPQLAKILTATFLGLDLGYIGCGAAVLFLAKRGLSLRSARRCVLLFASALLAGTALVPFAPSFEAIVGLLIAADFAIGLWIAMYLTFAQEVSTTAVSTTAGMLGGSGALAGALLMWLVGQVTQSTGSFALPFFGVGAISACAALAGWSASRRTPEGY